MGRWNKLEAVHALLQPGKVGWLRAGGPLPTHCITSVTHAPHPTTAPPTVRQPVSSHDTPPRLLDSQQPLTMATLDARGMAAMSSLRSCFTNSPVLILTGHFSWHMPSAAHVSCPS